MRIQSMDSLLKRCIVFICQSIVSTEDLAMIYSILPHHDRSFFLSHLDDLSVREVEMHLLQSTQALDSASSSSPSSSFFEEPVFQQEWRRRCALKDLIFSPSRRLNKESTVNYRGQYWMKYCTDEFFGKRRFELSRRERTSVKSIVHKLVLRRHQVPIETLESMTRGIQHSLDFIQQLDIRHVPKQEHAHVFSCVRGLPQLHTLNLYHTRFTPSTLDELVSAMTSRLQDNNAPSLLLKPITSLGLIGCTFAGSVCQSLLFTLLGRYQRTLTRLDCTHSLDDMDDLVPFLELVFDPRCSIRWLSIRMEAGEFLQGDHHHALLKLELASLSNTHHLLNNAERFTGLHLSGSILVQRRGMGLSNLQELNLSQTEFRPETSTRDWTLVAQVLTRCPALTTLDLSSCALDGLVALKIFNALATLGQLQELNLSQNPIGPLALERGFRPVLASNARLTRLNVQYIGIGPTSCFGFFSMLRPGALTELELGENQLKDAGFQPILELALAKHWTYLGVGGNQITVAGLRQAKELVVHLSKDERRKENQVKRRPLVLDLRRNWIDQSIESQALLEQL